MRLRTTVLEIAGMRTARCAQLVYTALAGVPGARAARVVVGRAEVEHEADVAADALADAVASVGFAVTRAETGAAGLPVL
jgi:copper chaperone CopZ